eukprot:NODE_7119_length_472_cov_50.059102_g6302_i0.p3 GENE.NODE_7119_length_472_cov_50.059102_g6302_i0~~NODE_7119_length_472_cov_50.059102_g6302_i0.p3  ORF type:complete len:64 (+),score=12.56 NODE_7119_length_472_cov_50.059102_g6302_i0:118-309(+)
MTRRPVNPCASDCDVCRLTASVYLNMKRKEDARLWLKAAVDGNAEDDDEKKAQEKARAALKKL